MSESMASLIGRPSGSSFFFPSPSMPAFIAASSSSTESPSSALNFDSRLESPAVSCATESASASSAITFSSIFSKAASELSTSIAPEISLTFFCVLALCARALSVSFLLFASASLVSRILPFASSFSTLSFCSASWPLSWSAFSWLDFFRVSASRASSSSPLLSASCARWYQSSAALCAASYLRSSCFCDAITCAVAWRSLVRSCVMSTTV
mmetsp:Transcript_9509/g.39102  ORF Transcript_9509/g.39102 Transcript_9509/m.39102 type:complete len:211 (+) Transcript_9509:257-889(+)